MSKKDTIREIAHLIGIREYYKGLERANSNILRQVERDLRIKLCRF